MKSILIYALLWLSFGVAHSLLTIPTVKQRFSPLLGSAYRLSYNLFAAVHIALVLLVGGTLLSGSRYAFFSHWVVVVVMMLVSVCGIVLILFSLRQYDLGQFSGLSQWRYAKSAQNLSSTNSIGTKPSAASSTDSSIIDPSAEQIVEPLNVTGLNSLVRHPLYSGLFLLIWGNAMSPFGFWTALFASVYLVVGAHYEERKLISIYGQAYIDYKERVPAFLPRRVRT